MEWPSLKDTCPEEYSIDLASPTFSKEDVKEWAEYMNDTPVTEDNYAERAEAYQKLCGSVTDLYRGEMPIKSDHMGFLCDKKLRALRSSWTAEGVSEPEVTSRKDAAERWTTVQAAELTLNPGLLRRARELGNSFTNSIYILGSAMAARQTAAVRCLIPGILASPTLASSLKSFLDYDRDENGSNFFKALITHLATNVDPLLIHECTSQSIDPSTPHEPKSYALAYTPERLMAEETGRFDALHDLVAASYSAPLYPTPTPSDPPLPSQDEPQQGEDSGNTRRANHWSILVERLGWRRYWKDGHASSS